MPTQLRRGIINPRAEYLSAPRIISRRDAFFMWPTGPLPPPLAAVGPWRGKACNTRVRTYEQRARNPQRWFTTAVARRE